MVKLICKVISSLVSVWYEFSLTGISKENIVSFEIILFRLHISKWKVLYCSWMLCKLLCISVFFTTHKFSLALKFHVSNKSNKSVMLSETSWSELIWNRKDWTVRKGNALWIWIQLSFIKNRMKISIKNFWFTLKLPEIMRISTFIIKKKLKTYI